MAASRRSRSEWAVRCHVLLSAQSVTGCLRWSGAVAAQMPIPRSAQRILQSLKSRGTANPRRCVPGRWGDSATFRKRDFQYSCLRLCIQDNMYTWSCQNTGAFPLIASSVFCRGPSVNFEGESARLHGRISGQSVQNCGYRL